MKNNNKLVSTVDGLKRQDNNNNNNNNKMKRKKRHSNSKSKYKSNHMKRSYSSPYHALPFVPNVNSRYKSSPNLILKDLTSSYSKKSVSVLKTQNIPSITSPISSPTKQNTKFIKIEKRAKSSKEHEEYETLKAKYQKKKEISRKNLRKGS